MAINRITGTMLKDDLIRDGVNLSFESDLLYIDVQNNRIGVNTNAPSVDCEINGSLIAGDMQIITNRLLVGNPAGLEINCSTNDIDVTDSKIVLCADPVDPQDVVNLRTLQANIGGISQNSISQGDSSVTVTDPFNGAIDFALDGATVGTMAYSDFNLSLNVITTGYIVGDHGEFGDVTIIGSTINNSNAGAPLTLSSANGDISLNGNVTFPAASTNRIVFTDAAGNLATDANLTYNSNTNLLTVADDAVFSATLTANGPSATIQDLVFTGSTVSTTSTDITIDTSTGNNDVTFTPGTGIVKVDATSGLVIPVGTTGERPASPDIGTIRFNTLTSEAEIWDGTKWDGFTADFAEFSTQAIDGDGILNSFTLSQSAVSKSIIVDINGVVQEPDSSYVASGTTISFTETPQLGDRIIVRHIANLTDVRAVADAAGTTRYESVAGVLYAYVADVEQLKFDGTAAHISTTLQPVTDLGQNLGAAAKRFNNLHVNLINGSPADVAENFESDQDYEPGTVVVIGGDADVTQCSQEGDTAVAGIVSTEPAYILNSRAENAVAVGLVGRVPCKIAGPVKRGELLIASSIPGHACALGNHVYVPGMILGKAMEDFSGELGVISVLIQNS